MRSDHRSPSAARPDRRRHTWLGRFVTAAGVLTASTTMAQVTITKTVLIQEGQTIANLPDPFFGLNATALRFDSVRSDGSTGFAVLGDGLVEGQWDNRVQLVWGQVGELTEPAVLWLPLEETDTFEGRWSGESEVGFALGRKGELLFSQRMFKGQCGDFDFAADIIDSIWVKPMDGGPLSLARGLRQIISSDPGWAWFSMSQPVYAGEARFWSGVAVHATLGSRGGLWKKGSSGLIQTLLRGGASLNGLPTPLASPLTVRSFAVSTDATNRLEAVGIAHSEIDPVITADNDVWLLVNELPVGGAAPINTGSAVAATGALPGEVWRSLHALGIGIGEDPEITYWGTTSAPPSQDEVFVRGGAVVVREGTTIGDVTLRGPVQVATCNASGDILVVWRDAVTLNNIVVLERGDAVNLESFELDGQGHPLPTRTAVVRNFLGPFPVALGSRKGDSSTLLFAVVSLEVPSHDDPLITDPSLNSDGRFGAVLRVDVQNFGPADCPGDFDEDGEVTVPDIFAFLSAWFAQDISADIDGNGLIEVPDIFAFLSLWFAGCA